MSVEQLSVTLRALGLVALYQGCGCAFFVALYGALLQRCRARLLRLAAWSAAAGIVLVLAHQTLEAARMADDFAGMADPAMLQLAWFSRNGAAHAAQALGLALAALASWRAAAQPARGDATMYAAAAGGIVAALGLTLNGHGHVIHRRGLFMALLALHLLVIAFWFGSLLPLLRVLRDEPRELARDILARFSALASWSVPLILAAGLAMAWLLLPDWSVFGRPYGRLLLAKLAGYMLLMPLAAWNKWRLAPALEAPGPGTVAALRRIIVAEYTLIAVVLAVTANLTEFFSPEA